MRTVGMGTLPRDEDKKLFALKQEIAELKSENTALKQEIAELKVKKSPQKEKTEAAATE